MSNATFVLVHGGAHTAKSWNLVRPELKVRGYESAAMDIPSGDPKLGLSDYADVVVETMRAVEGPVILVGHSLNGLTIPIAAARYPVSALVFVCALLPEIGKGYDPTTAEAEEKITAEVQRAINMHDEGIIFEMDPLLSIPAFYNESAPDTAKWAIEDLVPQSNVSVMPTPAYRVAPGPDVLHCRQE